MLACHLTSAILSLFIFAQLAVPASATRSDGRSGLSCSHMWKVVPSPNGVHEGGNNLGGVSFVSAKDGWAVGDFGLPEGTVHTLTEHWDGSAWTVVPSPDGPSGNGDLEAVSAVATDDVWAVGHAGLATLAMRWDGSAWEIVPTPSPGGASFLADVAAFSATDVWAVGYTQSGTNATLVEHWDGSTWTVVPSPNRGSSALLAIAATSPTDVWAVGDFLGARPFARSRSTGTAPRGPSSTARTWGAVTTTSRECPRRRRATSGRSARAIPEPRPSCCIGMGSDERVNVPSGGTLSAVSAISPTAAWAVGGTWPGYAPSSMRWNGTIWRAVSTPDPGDAAGLADVEALGPANVWGVGLHAGGDRTLIEHFC